MSIYFQLFYIRKKISQLPSNSILRQRKSKVVLSNLSYIYIYKRCIVLHKSKATLRLTLSPLHVWMSSRKRKKKIKNKFKKNLAQTFPKLKRKPMGKSHVPIVCQRFHFHFLFRKLPMQKRIHLISTDYELADAFFLRNACDA